MAVAAMTHAPQDAPCVWRRGLLLGTGSWNQDLAMTPGIVTRTKAGTQWYELVTGRRWGCWDCPVASYLAPGTFLLPRSPHLPPGLWSKKECRRLPYRAPLRKGMNGGSRSDWDWLLGLPSCGPTWRGEASKSWFHPLAPQLLGSILTAGARSMPSDWGPP